MKPFVGKQMEAETLIVSKMRQSQEHECIFFSYMELRAPSHACMNAYTCVHTYIYTSCINTHTHTYAGRKDINTEEEQSRKGDYD